MKNRVAKYYSQGEESFEYVIFHAWGQMADQDGAYPAAIIEKDDGTVVVTDADKIVFCTKEGE